MNTPAPMLGSVMTPRAPMRRPLISDALADPMTSPVIGSTELRGVVEVTPGARLEIARLVDRNRYALCRLLQNPALVLIQLADLEPFTAPPAVIRDSEF